jgi:hypothetical protein
MHILVLSTYVIKFRIITKGLTGKNLQRAQTFLKSWQSLNLA